MIPKLSGNTKDLEELKQSFTMNNGVEVLNTTCFQDLIKAVQPSRQCGII